VNETKRGTPGRRCRLSRSPRGGFKIGGENATRSEEKDLIFTGSFSGGERRSVGLWDGGYFSDFRERNLLLSLKLHAFSTKGTLSRGKKLRFRW